MRTEQLLFGRAFHHVIVTPHCDDELIGCSEIMTGADRVSVLVVPSSHETFAMRVKESREVLATLLKNQSPRILKDLEVCHCDKVTWRQKPGDADTLVFWFPDPAFEHHPEHKLFNADLQERILHNTAGFDTLFGLYSTNMRAPYLHTLDSKASANKMVLADCYKSQRGYFESHNDCFYYEGRILL